MPTRVLLVLLLVLAGCSSHAPAPPARTEPEVKAQLLRLIPASVNDRSGWAQDIYTAFHAQQLDPSTENLCAV